MASYPLGYPSWAAYQNSDPTFRVYKRFGTLRNRVILYRQQELAKLEEQLNALDIEDDEKHNHRIRSLRKDTADPGSNRMDLIDQIDLKLEHYGKKRLAECSHFILLNKYRWFTGARTAIGAYAETEKATLPKFGKLSLESCTHSTIRNDLSRTSRRLRHPHRTVGITPRKDIRPFDLHCPVRLVQGKLNTAKAK